MSTATTACPKCGHVRSTGDATPEWQCPSCGIAYAKFLPDGTVAALPPAHPDSPRAVKERAAIPDTGQSSSPATYTLSTYIALVALGAFLGTTRHWLSVLSLLCIFSFVFWIAAYRKKRAFEDIPTSRIASAAQGYVEICGRVEQAAGCELTGPLSTEPCVWFHYSITEERGVGSDKRTHVIESKSYGVPFMLRDDTGECLVHPSGAEVNCDTTYRQQKDNRTYSEASIRTGDAIHVIGSFATRATQPDENLEQKTAALLKAWLAEPQDFFKRFDGDGDGRIAAAELAKARSAARAELQQRSVNQGGTHTVRRPQDGRPYLIFNEDDHSKIMRISSGQVWFHLAVLIASFAFLTYHLSI